MKTKDNMLRTDVQMAYCEFRALHRRLKAEPRMQTELVARSLRETAGLMRSVSAQLRTLDARKKTDR